jgi:exopolyphosphatase/guanosine-5'-triphosphate,3'-diphosphate pyrophosphatase
VTSAETWTGRAGDVRAAVDIGTNSIHLVVARVAPGGGFEILTREKESVRLGLGSGDMELLAPDAIDRGIETLRRFRQLADSFDATIRAVATSAVREAANRDEFLRRARDEAGIEVEVISGVEEARLIHLGVLQAVPVFDRQHLTVDIGGGSTEFVVAKGHDVHVARSVKLGAIRLTDRFFADGVVRSRQVRECRSYIDAYLAPLAHEVEPWGFEVTVGSSGTINAIAAMVEHRRGRDASRGVNNVAFSREDLAAVTEALVAARTPEQRLESVPGLDPRRADIIVGGAILLEEIFDRLGIGSMIASEYALREGVLLDVVGDHVRDTFHHLSDIRRQGVQRVIEMFERDRPHVEHSTDLALRLFDGTQALHGLPASDRELLEHAAMLHDIGEHVAVESHHKHTAYLIEHGRLRGFDPGDIDVLSTLGRYHRRNDPKGSFEPFGRLAPPRRREVLTLLALLRLADGLDRGHAETVEEVDVEITPTAVRLLLSSPGDMDLEVWGVRRKRELFERVFERRLDVVAADHPSVAGRPA